jgi:hypothetical protein
MKLRARITIAAVATAAAVGTTGAFLLPIASARAVTHTLAFTSVQQATATFSPTINGAEDKDVNKAGKVIGYDVLRFSVNPKTNTTSIGVAVDLSGGFLYGVMSESDGPVTHGTVTGGTGAFKGATGTITAKALNQNGTRIAVTITYHT